MGAASESCDVLQVNEGTLLYAMNEKSLELLIYHQAQISLVVVKLELPKRQERLSVAFDHG